MFAVDDIEDVVARLHTHGAELVGELAQYEDSYRLCYVRGPEGIIVGLAEEQLRSAEATLHPWSEQQRSAHPGWNAALGGGSCTAWPYVHLPP